MLRRPKDEIKGIACPKSTIVQLRALVRKGTDAQLADYFERVVIQSINDIAKTIEENPEEIFMQRDEFVRIKGREFECVCPECGETITLDLKTMAEEQSREEETK